MRLVWCGVGIDSVVTIALESKSCRKITATKFCSVGTDQSLRYTKPILKREESSTPYAFPFLFFRAHCVMCKLTFIQPFCQASTWQQKITVEIDQKRDHGCVPPGLKHIFGRLLCIVAICNCNVPAAFGHHISSPNE